MEFIFVILFFLFFGWIVRAVISTMRAAGKAAIGKGSLKENLELEFRGMGALRARITQNQKPDEPFFLGVEVRGLFPVYSNTTIGFVSVCRIFSWKCSDVYIKRKVVTSGAIETLELVNCVSTYWSRNFMVSIKRSGMFTTTDQ